MKFRTGENGMVLVVVILLMSVLVLMGTTVMLSTSTDLKIGSNYRLSQEALYAAEGGAEYGLNRLRASLIVPGGDTSSVVPPAITGFTFENTGSFLALSGGVVQKSVTGDFSGLTASCQKYIITSTARKTGTNARATVVYDLEDQLIPLFQFGIFYDDDLEIIPSSARTVAGGPVHSNSNIYLFPTETYVLSIDSRITAAGSIVHNRKDYSPGTVGTVRIKDADVIYVPLTIDFSTPTWKADALANWDGRVLTAEHGAQRLEMTLPPGGEPIDILGAGSQSLRQKAGLKIINGVATNKYGNSVNLAVPGPNPLSIETFYDLRENDWMNVVQVDINLLRANTVAMAALNDPPAGGEARILYISSTSSYISNPAVRLVNGGTLPAGGLSVATNNPLYIRGNYNTADLPAGIFSDAVTVLSGNWSDSHSNWSLSSRDATSTTVRAAIMTGIINTVGGQWSGGWDNTLRLLEDWAGRTLTYSGSLVCLWQSQQATAPFPGSGYVYAAPTRTWSYGISLANLPPGTPLVRSVQVIGRKQVIY